MISAAVFLGLCAGLAQLTPPPARTPRDVPIPLGHGEERTAAEFRADLDSGQPGVVWVGSSLARNADPDQLEGLIGRPCYRIRINSSGAVIWYLVLKNVVLAAPHRPALAMIFFVDTELTSAAYRVETEGQLQGIEALKQPEDAWLLMQCAGYGASDPVDYVLRNSFTAYDQSSYLKNAAADAVKRAAVRPLGPIDNAAVEDALGRVFDPRLMDPELLWALQEASERTDEGAFDFAQQVEKSFLPHMINTANAAGVRLVFVRIKRLRDTTPGKQSPELQTYVASLREYVESRGAALIDFSEDPRLPRDFYTDGDHVDEAGRTITTAMIAEKIAAFFPDSAAILSRSQAVQAPVPASPGSGEGLVACQGAVNLVPNGSFAAWKPGVSGALPESFMHANSEALSESAVPSRIKEYDGPDKIDGVIEEWQRPYHSDSLFRCLSVVVPNTDPGKTYRLSAVADNRSKGFVQLRVLEMEPMENGNWKPGQPIGSAAITLSRQAGFRRYAVKFRVQKNVPLLVVSLAPPEEDGVFPIQVVWKEWCISETE
jgi:hypothetical protein